MISVNNNVTFTNFILLSSLLPLRGIKMVSAASSIINRNIRVTNNNAIVRIRQFKITLNHASWNQFMSDVDKVRVDVDTVNNRSGASRVYTYSTS